jgi:hypothetical protein
MSYETCYYVGLAADKAHNFYVSRQQRAFERGRDGSGKPSYSFRHFGRDGDGDDMIL